MKVLDVLGAVLVSFARDPRTFLVNAFLYILAAVLVWEVFLPALWAQYWPFG